MAIWKSKSPYSIYCGNEVGLRGKTTGAQKELGSLSKDFCKVAAACLGGLPSCLRYLGAVSSLL